MTKILETFANLYIGSHDKPINDKDFVCGDCFSPTHTKINPSEDPRKVALHELILKIGRDCEYLIVVPALRKGGGDLVVLNYVNAILANRSDSKITVFAVGFVKSPWGRKLPTEVRFVEFCDNFERIFSDDNKKLIFASLLQYIKPRILHLINTPQIAHETLIRYSKYLNKDIHIYFSIFVLPENIGVKYHKIFAENVLQLASYSDKIFVDNHTIAYYIKSKIKIPNKKISVHYQPLIKHSISKIAKMPTIIDKPNFKVLWAARLDVDKRIDILLKIADDTLIKSMEIEFHVYGSPVVDKFDISIFENYENVIYEGPFDDGIWSIRCNYFDAFLMTSEVEGLPNAALQAINEGLVVITPDVGGVSELITDETGYLIPEFDNVSQYISAIKQLIGDKGLAKNKYQKALELIKRRHTWENFLDLLTKEEDYLRKFKKS